MRGSSKTTPKKMKQKEKKEDDEVEQLLRSAQDEIMLNLSVNSHIAHRASPSTADLDLERRFQALKTKTKDQTPQTLVGVDDLSARLDALKAKSSPPPSAAAASKLVSDYEEESEDDEEVQIQKLIEWAKDAARLDPSPPSPPESDNDDDDDDHSN